MLALIVALGACSENKNTDTGVDTNRVATGVIATDPKDSLGPAPEVPGATKGGTFTVIRETQDLPPGPAADLLVRGPDNAPLYARS